MEILNFVAGLASIISLILAIFITNKVYNISKTITKIYQNNEVNVFGNKINQQASGLGHKQVGGDYHGR